MLDKTWRFHRREVRRLHEKLFYRPLLSAVARMPGFPVALSTEAAGERLAALGYRDPEGALRHLEALTSGVTRTANVQRALLPVLLQWFADGPDPDAGLFGFRRISDSLGSTPWFLRRCATRGRSPSGSPGCCPPRATRPGCWSVSRRGCGCWPATWRRCRPTALAEEMLAGPKRQQDAEKAVARGPRRTPPGAVPDRRRRPAGARRRGRRRGRAVPAHRRDAGGHPGRGRRRGPSSQRTSTPRRPGSRSSRWVGTAASSSPTAATPTCCSSTSRRTASTSTRRRRTPRRSPTSCAGCWPCPGPTLPLQVDADLRPEGKQGPLVRTLDSYAAYYAKWSKVWEAQALLRADAVVGDEDLRRRFTELIDPLRFPEGGLSDDDTFEVRRIKARVDDERLPRGVSPQMHLKLGRGGLADIEWTVQLLQLQHAYRVPGLRTSRTLDALTAAQEAGLVAERGRRAAGGGLADGQPDPQRGHPGPWQARRRVPQRHHRAGRRGQHSRLPTGRHRGDGQRLPACCAGRAAGRGPGLLGLTGSPSLFGTAGYRCSHDRGLQHQPHRRR